MRMLLFVVPFLAAVAPAAAIGTSQADGACLRGRCLIEVGGRKYLSGPCNIDSAADGSFSIRTGNGGRASRYFAYVNLNGDGTAEGSWNGVQAESHAHESLGTLRRRGGACWANARARVCAWR
jgi:hypothetical protein